VSARQGPNRLGGSKGVVGSANPRATASGVAQRLLVILAREIGERVADQKGLDVEHEGFRRGHQAADVGVHPADQQLVAAHSAQPRFQVGAFERAVAPLGQHGVAGEGRNRVHDARRFGPVGNAFAPEIVQQGAVFGRLPAGLRGVEYRNAGLSGRGDQAGAAVQKLRDGRLRWIVEIQEILLQIVHQQRGARRLGPPGDLAFGEFARHLIRGDAGNAHDVLLFVALAMSRSFCLASLPGAVSGR
jgi:hypothetical protein